jgi:hypothetical protein
VKYSEVQFFDWFGKLKACVTPVDHPDTLNVTNGQKATTSEVISRNDVTGVFETRNTIYVPV